ncbi:hypothetical protein DPMN_140951 [Dreissena polymorpha]|uniref:Uncharacterized protein n=1 Tax=Dreissena polymorpha TaxID=45954 RepID=A0A9D4GBT0_DREPO|nr:hypothetical protein DPMN_140951 [Dreissena polymorpha]
MLNNICFKIKCHLSLTAVINNFNRDKTKIIGCQYQTVSPSINDATIANNSITFNQRVFELRNDGKDREVEKCENKQSTQHPPIINQLSLLTINLAPLHLTTVLSKIMITYLVHNSRQSMTANNNTHT